jgi:MarR family transcriptional regulator, transcriptional regulator for hemolysin
MIEGPSNAADLAERFENALYNSARAWRDAVDRRLECLGISPASWMTIAVASQARSPLSQSELADMLSVSRASMVHVIDRLATAGLVMREPSVSDRRVNLIVITDAGHRIYAELKNEAAALRRQLLSSIELEKLAHLTGLLEQLLRIAVKNSVSSRGYAD